MVREQRRILLQFSGASSERNGLSSNNKKYFSTYMLHHAYPVVELNVPNRRPV
jgi:hypothetical protein